MHEATADPVDGDPVNANETLLRFAEPRQWDDQGMPTTASLTLKAGEDGLSVYLEDLLAGNNIGPAVVIANRSGYGVYGLRASDVTSGGACAVLHNPLHNDTPVEIGFAHALIWPPADKPTWKLLRDSLLKSPLVRIAPRQP